MKDYFAIAVRELRCRDCAAQFTFPADEGEGIWFRERGYPDPIRCPACRGLARQGARGGSEPNTAHICRECSGAFVLSPADVAWFEAKGLFLPARCSACRRKRRGAADKAEELNGAR